MPVFGARRRTAINYDDQMGVDPRKSQGGQLQITPSRFVRGFVAGVNGNVGPVGTPDQQPPARAPGSSEAANQYIMHGRNPNGSYGQPQGVFSRAQYESGEAVRPFVNAGGMDERGAVGGSGTLGGATPHQSMLNVPTGMFAGGKKQHKGLFPGKDGKTWARIVAGAIDGYLAGQGNPAALERIRHGHLMQREKAQAEAEMEQMRWKNSQPRFEQVGDTYGTFDPASGSFSPIFRDPQPFEAYADSLGYERGSEDWRNAVENYRLGSWSDPAVEAKRELTGYRYDRSDAQLGRRLNQSDINNRRSTGVSRENNIRSTGVSRENNIRSTGQSNTNNVRSTNTSRANAVLGASTRMSTSRKPGVPVMVNTPEEARRLPPGTKFMRPDGTVMVR